MKLYAWFNTHACLKINGDLFKVTHNIFDLGGFLFSSLYEKSQMANINQSSYDVYWVKRLPSLP